MIYKSIDKLNRYEVVLICLELIKKGVGMSPEITEFNNRIITKWSSSALIYIKDKAWKLYYSKEK